MDAAILVLTVVTILNSLVLVGLVRQVGLLHLRISPVPALEGIDEIDRDAPLPIENPPWMSRDDNDVEDGIFVFAFLSTTCSLCRDVIPGLPGLARIYRDAVFVVTESAVSDMTAHLNSLAVDIPVLGLEHSMNEIGIPGTPFVAITDRLGYVRGAGAVNTLEQIEYLIEQSTQIPAESMDEDRDASSKVLDKRGTQ